VEAPAIFPFFYILMQQSLEAFFMVASCCSFNYGIANFERQTTPIAPFNHSIISFQNVFSRHEASKFKEKRESLKNLRFI
jgi:hypothetical protein